tara:strand:+ start:677 stop:1324 length:648 start_codon:yes stop_codon:yes gene_type:complete
MIEGEGKIKIIKPFGPSVAQIQIPETLIKELNDYVDRIIKDEKKTKVLDHGPKLAGNVKQEFVLEEDFMKKINWPNFLGAAVQKWIQMTMGQKIKKFEILSSWIVRQFENEYNPLHWHNGHISGVGFLKVPKNLGDQFQKNKKVNFNGNLQLIHGSRMFLSGSTLDIKPEVGYFYFFPNYLMHTVYPFSNTNEERRSISFNANIDELIYNIYELS